MARPGVHPFWREQIYNELAEDPALSGAAIRRKFVRLKGDLIKETPPTDPPSDRAIRRIKKQFEALAPAERRPYERFSWPESMESGALPWEASRAALDLLRYRYATMPTPPRINEVKRFWQVTQAIPDAPIEMRNNIAGLLNFEAGLHTRGISDLQSHKQAMRWFQWYMAYEPWRSPEDKQAWLKLPDELRSPPPHLEPIVEPLIAGKSFFVARVL
jgi:hypothetical protein